MVEKWTRKRVILVLAVAAALLGLALPISNLLLGRTYLEVASEDEQFHEFSAMFQKNCADCHTPDLTTRPLYFSFPVASSVIQQDMQVAQTHFVVTADQLEGKTPLNSVQLAKIKKVLDDGAMPPTRYRAMHWDAGLDADEQSRILAWKDGTEQGTDPRPIPIDNPFNPDPAKAALGEKLYHDVRLSGDQTVSCASCHALDKGGTDQAVVSTGIDGQQGPINAPTVFNAAFHVAQFWDGRAADLKEQAGGPVTNPLEMGGNWEEVVARLADDEQYQAAFQETYEGKITSDTITDAIAEYEKTLLTPNSPFDRYLRGDQEALTAEEIRGYELFVANGCATCHTGVNLGGLTYEKMGLKSDYFTERGGEFSEADQGRFNVTKQETDRSKFKVPTLRNVALTGPYFHDGSSESLQEAVQTMARVQTGSELSEADAARIVLFLKTLTGEYRGQSLADASS